MKILKIGLVLLMGSVLCPADEGGYAALVEGVKAIDKPGAPGPLVVWGAKAFPVVVGESGDHVEPLVAAAEMGEGRVVAFGHNGYLGSTGADTARLRRNAVLWASGEEDVKRVKVGLLRGAGKLKGELEGAGFRVEEEVDLARLGTYEVLVFDAGSLGDERDRERVGKFIRGGGGVVCGSVGWGWMQVTKGKELREHPGTLLLAEAGIAWADGTIDAGDGGVYSVREAMPVMAHAGRSVEALAAGTGDAGQTMAVVSRALRTLPREVASFYGPLDAVVAESGGKSVVPKPGAPILESDAMGRFLLAYACGGVASGDPEKMVAHPAAAVFPGKVKKGARAETKSVEVDCSVRDWHSTGLYAVPGEVVHVRIPEGAEGAGLKVRIGCHSDRLYHKDEWERAPEISFQWALKDRVTKVANPFGGLVYVVVPRNCALGEIGVDIAGAVEAPLFVRGETDVAKWREVVRSTGAPWAEFASDKVVVSLPTESARRVRDPEDLMRVWDRILDLCAELKTLPLERERPERIVCDQQISAGYMHSGYPIMTFMDQIENFASAKHLEKEGNWGIYHELGHNHQAGEWTFEGTTEVTCNLFSLYVFDKLVGVPPEEHDRSNKEAREKRMREYLGFGRGRFEVWKSKPFVALTMYVQLQQEFGWESFQKVFAEYEGLAKEDRPKDDDEERDQWMVRFSNTVGRNLGPFFEAWGVPTSEGARASVAELPEWVPKEMGRYLKS